VKFAFGFREYGSIEVTLQNRRMEMMWCVIIAPGGKHPPAKPPPIGNMCGWTGWRRFEHGD